MCLCSVVVQYFFAECLCRRIVHCDCAVLLRRCLLMYVGWAGPHPPHLIPAQAHFQCPSFLCVVPVRCGCALPQRVAGCSSFGSLFICCFCRAWLWTISAQCAHAVWSCTMTRCGRAMYLCSVPRLCTNCTGTWLRGSTCVLQATRLSDRQ